MIIFYLLWRLWKTTGHTVAVKKSQHGGVIVGPRKQTEVRVGSAHSLS